jgi:triosephosphate isomerase
MSAVSPAVLPFVIAANWKMNKGPSEATEFLKEFVSKSKDLPANNKVIFFVPAVDLWVAQMVLRESKIEWGAQNCYFEMDGAFTGETSPMVLAQMGVPNVLIGHSERRTIFKENNADCSRKVRAAHKVQLVPMLCVGETLVEREAGQTDLVIAEQLRVGLMQRNPALPLMIAYEPVWAIGTGKVATSKQANDAHAALRGELRAIGGDTLADQTPILYGGSVKPENAQELAQQPEINGFLVGGASLKVDSFLVLAQTTKG